MNDTHPTVAVAELMRILMDEEGLGWDDAWDITTKHVLTPTIQSWLRHLRNGRSSCSRACFLVYIRSSRRSTVVSFLRSSRNILATRTRSRKMAILYDGQVKMAHLAIVAGYSVNGVAYLHTEILKNTELNDFYEMYPEKFNNKTNGITQSLVNVL